MAVFDKIPDELIWEQYQRDNYLIELDESSRDNRCCIYFSSNGLCFPETRQNFVKTFMEKNQFEWYRKRIKEVKKSIFVRDILKNFYVLGINARYNNLEKLCEFLKQESRGYEVITVGSSAGGYAAAVCGILLSARTVFDFSGQISLWDYSDYKNKQFLQKYSKDERYCKYYNLQPFLKNNTDTNIIYTWAALAKEDIFQFEKIKNLDEEHIISIPVRTHRHGMPIFPVSLEFFFGAEKENGRPYEFSGGGGYRCFDLPCGLAVSLPGFGEYVNL